MATPITWRDLNSPNFASSNNLISQAGASLTRSLDSASGIADDLVRRDEENVQRRSNAFLEAIRAQYGNDPAALQAAQQSGAIEQLRSQYGKIDNERTGVGALDSIISQAREKQTQERAFADSEQRFANRDARNEFDLAVANEDFTGARKITDNTDFLQEGELIRQLTGAERAQATRQQQEADAAQKRQRDNYAYGRLIQDHQRADKERALNDSINDQLRNHIGSTQEAIQTHADADKNLTNDIIDAGLDPSQLPNENYLNSLGPQQFDQALGFIQASKAVNALAPDTNQIQSELITSLINQGANPNQLQGVLQTTGALDSAINARSPQEQRAFDSAKAGLNNDPTYRSSLLVQEYKNPQPFDEVEIRDSLGEVYDDLPSGIKDSMSEVFNTLYSDGYVGPKGEKIQLPKALIKIAMSRLPKQTGILGKLNPSNDLLTEEIDKLLDEGTFDEELNTLERYKAEEAAINRQFATGPNTAATDFLSTLDVQGLDANRRSSDAAKQTALDEEIRRRAEEEQARREFDERRRNRLNSIPEARPGRF